MAKQRIYRGPLANCLAAQLRTCVVNELCLVFGRRSADKKFDRSKGIDFDLATLALMCLMSNSRRVSAEHCPIV